MLEVGGQVRWVSNSVEKLLGWAPDEIAGRSTELLWDPRDDEALEQKVERGKAIVIFTDGGEPDAGQHDFIVVPDRELRGGLLGAEFFRFGRILSRRNLRKFTVETAIAPRLRVVACAASYLALVQPTSSRATGATTTSCCSAPNST